MYFGLVCVIDLHWYFSYKLLVLVLHLIFMLLSSSTPMHFRDKLPYFLLQYNIQYKKILAIASLTVS